ncbi:Ankyrin repeat domain-containing protein 1 [Hondaea fermentalgiana]|uniref:Ankyrin repeat domain-containing protein 1 n=1 Tax=Hondaea fermentalgiana TaxID=2315210 RepID=A0A2R5GGP4_9STRA|nr:Ankyrin repeat domain-containing protein 1 [Hondaea fermentalgiana]|eukprot:GBG30076.1 Ankyrin repeat domain-containing protein 1 [Hondaea fermentalgiana]
MSGRSTADRLRALASEVDATQQRQKSRISGLEGQLARATRAKDQLVDEKDELDYELLMVKRKLATAEESAKVDAEGHAAQVRRLQREIAALRFELAATKKSERNLTRKLEDSERMVARLENKDGDEDEADDQPKLHGSGLFAWATDPADEDPADEDLMHEDEFINAAKRGLSSVLRSVLEPSPNEFRDANLHKVLDKALIESAAHGSSMLESIKFLLGHGAQVNASKPVTEGGRTALHTAAAKGHKDVVMLLLSQPEIRIDCLDAQGRTPLHLAARLRKPEAARVLLRKGADPDLLTADGQSALDLARGSAEQDSQWFSLSFKPTMSITQVFESPSVQFWNASALGLRYYKTENWERSHEYFSRAVKLAEGAPQLANPRDLSRLFYNRAKVGLRLGEVLQALNDSSAALARDEDYVNALEIRAECHTKLFNFERATADYNKLLDKKYELPDGIDSDRLSEWRQKASETSKLVRASHYEILGINKRASTAQIKRAFRECSIRWHPDKHSKSEDDMHRARIQFQRINEAREVLLNSNRRIIYDSQRARPKGFGSYSFGYDDDEDDEDDYYFQDSEDDDDDDDDGDVYQARKADGSLSKSAQQKFPWFDEARCKSLAESKASFQARMLELQREQAAREEQIRLDEAAKAAADRAATMEAQRSKLRAAEADQAQSDPTNDTLDEEAAPEATHPNEHNKMQSEDLKDMGKAPHVKLAERALRPDTIQSWVEDLEDDLADELVRDCTGFEQDWESALDTVLSYASHGTPSKAQRDALIAKAKEQDLQRRANISTTANVVGFETVFPTSMDKVLDLDSPLLQETDLDLDKKVSDNVSYSTQPYGSMSVEEELVARALLRRSEKWYEAPLYHAVGPEVLVRFNVDPSYIDKGYLRHTKLPLFSLDDLYDEIALRRRQHAETEDFEESVLRTCQLFLSLDASLADNVAGQVEFTRRAPVLCKGEVDLRNRILHDLVLASSSPGDKREEPTSTMADRAGQDSTQEVSDDDDDDDELSESHESDVQSGEEARTSAEAVFATATTQGSETPSSSSSSSSSSSPLPGPSISPTAAGPGPTKLKQQTSFSPGTRSSNNGGANRTDRRRQRKAQGANK